MGFGQLSLKGRALRCLAAREYSHAELRQKLAPHAEAPDDIDTLIIELQAKGFLDDRRAAESLVRQKSQRYGLQRVRLALRAKGLTGDEASAALAPLADTELARARAVWQRRFDVPPANAAERARQSRFLLARGFAGGVVSQVLRGIPEDDAYPEN